MIVALLHHPRSAVAVDTMTEDGVAAKATISRCRQDRLLIGQSQAQFPDESTGRQILNPISAGG
jgi:hypothetical protein